MVQWGSEYGTSLVFKWSKRGRSQMVWFFNAIWIPDSPTNWIPDKWTPSCFHLPTERPSTIRNPNAFGIGAPTVFKWLVLRSPLEVKKLVVFWRFIVVLMVLHSKYYEKSMWVTNVMLVVIVCSMVFQLLALWMHVLIIVNFDNCWFNNFTRTNHLFGIFIKSLSWDYHGYFLSVGYYVKPLM